MVTDLTSKLNTYNILIGVFIIFIIIAIVTYKVNVISFNAIFGKEIFLTLVFLIVISTIIKEIIVYNSEPNKSLLRFLPYNASPYFMPAVIILTGLISLGGFFAFLDVSGVLAKSPSTNKTSVILNMLVIVAFIFISVLTLRNSTNKDEQILNMLPTNIAKAYKLRTLWTIIFFIFILSIVTLYFGNPANIMSSYGKPTIFFVLFIGLVMLSMITFYQYFLSNQAQSYLLDSIPGFASFIVKGLYVLSALGISGLLIYGLLKVLGVFNQNASDSNNWPHYILNFILLGSLLGILYKLIFAGGFLEKSPLFRLVFNTIMYIPCILIYLISSVYSIFNKNVPSEKFAPATQSEKTLLGVSLALLTVYFIIDRFFIPYLYKKITTQGGKQYINDPIPTNIQTNIASYQTLNNIVDPDKHNYNYGLSFWLYIDSFPPSTSASYTKVVNILSLGDNPAIKYDALNNTLFVSVKQNTEPVFNYIKENGIDISKENLKDWKNVKLNYEKDSLLNDINKNNINKNDINENNNNNERIIYKKHNFLLQKWNNITINYTGGTLDIFLNGELVKSATEVVPYISYDMLTVGTDNGISGSVANLVYFTDTISALTISNIYNSLKDKNPPIMSNKYL